MKLQPFKVAEQTETGDRRLWSRHPAPATYVEVGEDNSIILDISEGGLALQAARSFGNGELPQITFLFAGFQACIETSGRIAWRSESRNVAGVEFVGLSDQARKQIREWISLETRLNGYDEKHNLAEQSVNRRGNFESERGPLLPKPELAQAQDSSSSPYATAPEILFTQSTDAPGGISPRESVSISLEDAGRLHGTSRSRFAEEKKFERSRAQEEPKVGKLGSRNLYWLALSLILASVLVIGFFELRSRRSLQAFTGNLELPAESGMGLKLEHVGRDWRLSWNPDAPVIAAAIKGHLSITDGTLRKVLDLDPSDLRGGTMMYTPLTNEVILRLDLDSAASQTPISESIRITSGAPSSPTVQAPSASHGDGRTDAGRNASAVTARARAAEDSATRSEVSTPADRELPIGLLKPLRTDQSKTPSHLGPAENTPTRSSQAAEASIPAPALQAPLQFASTSNLAPIPPEPPAPTTYTAGLEPAQLIDRKDPVYPAVLRETRLSGTVLVRFHVRADGTVHDVSVVKGNLALGQAAIEAVQKWHYKPARLNGTPIETEANAVLEFNP